jgi:hypothetical protein
MTIREYIKRRFRNLLVVPVVALAVGVLLRITLPHRPFVITATGLGFLAAFAWTVWNVGRIACPRCSVRLGSSAMVFATMNPKFRKCPHCGVSLDEPMP